MSHTHLLVVALLLGQRIALKGRHLATIDLGTKANRLN